MMTYDKTINDLRSRQSFTTASDTNCNEALSHRVSAWGQNNALMSGCAVVGRSSNHARAVRFVKVGTSWEFSWPP